MKILKVTVKGRGKVEYAIHAYVELDGIHEKQFDRLDEKGKREFLENIVMGRPEVTFEDAGFICREG